MCIKVWNEHVLQDKRLPMPNISYERANTNHRITSEWELMSSLNRSLAWLAAIKQSRIENTLAHDLPFRENDSLVFIWLALNRQMTVSMMGRESEREIYERTKGSLAHLVFFFRRTDGMESEFRRGWRVQCVLQGTVVSCTPLTSVQTRTGPLLTLPGSISILMKSGTIICDCCALGEKGWLTWMDWCQQAFSVGLHGDFSERPQINIPWSNGKCMTVHIKTGQKYRANVFNEHLIGQFTLHWQTATRHFVWVCRISALRLSLSLASRFHRLNMMSRCLSGRGVSGKWHTGVWRLSASVVVCLCSVIFFFF